ncbi:MAG: pilus assembly protein N-terminal domain-containing protein [Velocimicrobium sp.]
MHKILEMNTTLHKANILKFIGIMDEKLVEYYSDTSIAIVDSNSIVTVLKPGNTVVTASSEGLTIMTVTDADGNEIGQVYVRVRQ